MKKNYILEQEIARLRSQDTLPQDFRRSLEKVGEYIGLEIAETLQHTEHTFQTPMNEYATHTVVDEKIAIIGVLRAGLPLYNGLLNVFPTAESGFIGAMRDEETLKSTITYSALPEMEGKSVIIADTMLATGGTMCDVIDEVAKYKPRQIITACAIASQTGINKVCAHRVLKNLDNLAMYEAVVDETLNENGYILPGLGDAGDRCYGATSLK